MHRSQRLFVLSLCACFPAVMYGQTYEQPTYLDATGSPTFAVNIPVPNGYINVANGNLHMEFPLATHKQRGKLALNERLVYDSRIWKIVAFSHHYWWPYNVLDRDQNAGWRLIQGNETGTLDTSSVQYTTQVPCHVDGDPDPVYQTENHNAVTWADPNGTKHTFDGTVQSGNDCDGNYTSTVVPGYSLDGTGYQLKDDGTGAPLILDPSGNEVYPKVVDRFGNYWSSDSSGNLVDDLGRTPVITTKNGSQTYYDVLAPNGNIQNSGTRVRYIVTTTDVKLQTAFHESGVKEYQENNAESPTVAPVQSIQLPDGSKYQFTYDTYGEVTSVTLPTGGTVQYGWTNFMDSYQNVNRWITSVVNGDGTTTFTPQVLTQCSSKGTGCQEQVTAHRPSGDDTVYTSHLDNGAWNVQTTVYSGAASNNKPVASNYTTYNYTTPCTNQDVCTAFPGAQYVTKSLETTTLADTGQSTQVETNYADPRTGQVTGSSQWDYFTGSAPTTPTRSASYKYQGTDLQSETRKDGQGNVVSSTTYSYANDASPTSGVVGHGAAPPFPGNPYGPYLTTITRSNSGSPTSISMTNQYDDTGALIATQDYNQNPVTSFHYDPTHTFVIETDRPDTQTGGTTYHHVTKASYDAGSGAILTSDDENSVAHNQSSTVHYDYETTAGRLHSVTYPDGGSTTYAYPTPNRVDTTVAQSAGVNVTSSTISDGYGRPYQSVAGDAMSEQTYDANGRPYSASTPHRGSQSPTDGTTYIFYDALDRQTSVQKPDGSIVATLYAGNKATTTDELGNRTQRTYNVFGNLTQVLENAPTTSDLTLETDYQVDGLGNTTCVEQHGNVQGTGCSSASSSDATSPWRVRRFYYDQLSRLRAASVPEHTAGSDHPGSQNCGTPDNGSGWTDCYGYDPNGNRTRHTDNRGVTVSYGYDALNRLTTETAPTLQNSYSYDAGANGSGLLYSQSSGAAASTYGYDVMGRVVTQNSCSSGTCGSNAAASNFFSMAASYDLSGNLTGLTYPDGRVIQNAYDTMNRLSSVQYAQWANQPVGTTYWSSPSYAPPGQLNSAQFGNGVTLHAAYNSALTLGSLNYQTTQATLWGKSYQWASDGMSLLSVTDALTSYTRKFQYDNLKRLASAQDFSGGAPATGTATISGAEKITSGVYDTGTISLAVNNFNVSASYRRGSTPASLAIALNSALNGNGSPVTSSVSGSTISLKSKAQGDGVSYALSATSSGTNGTADFSVALSGSSMVGGPSAPLQGGLNQQYSIDAWGNLTSMGASGFTQSVNNQNQVVGFGYDAVGRVIADGSNSYTYNDDGRLTASGDGANYIYDGAGQRTAVTDSTRATGFVYFAGVLIAAQNLNTGAWTDYIYAGQRKIAQVEGSQAATPVYDLPDHLGSNATTADNAGAVAMVGDYAPFGQLLSGTVADPLFYAHLQRDADGLDHAGARQYSSVTGRWTTPDPYDGSYTFAFPQSLNRYAYVSNSPLGGIDPSGEDPGSGSQNTINVPGETVNVFADPPKGSEVESLLADILTVGLDKLFELLAAPTFKGSLFDRPLNKPPYTRTMNCGSSAGQVMTAVEGNFAQFGNYSRFFGAESVSFAPPGNMGVGSTIPINVGILGFNQSLSVNVAAMGPGSMTFTTNPGHLIYPGSITFAASPAGAGAINFSISISGTVANSAEFNFGGSGFEDAQWNHFLGQVGSFCGVGH